MSKGGIFVLIIAALVFGALGFVAGQVVQSAGTTPGSSSDPAVTQGYVDKLVGDRTTALQTEIDELKAMLEKGDATVTTPADSTQTEDPAEETPSTGTYTKVKVTAADVNIRQAASVSASVVGTATNGNVLTYLGATNAGDAVWYHVQLSDGKEGYIRSDLCGSPY